MTELSFLLELLLNHKLPKATQLAIRDRIGSIQLEASLPAPRKPIIQGPEPVAQIAQSPAAAQALAQRQAAIQAALSDKPEQGRTSPRKF